MNDVDDTSSVVPEANDGADPAMSSPLPEERAPTMLEVTDESSPETTDKSKVVVTADKNGGDNKEKEEDEDNEGDDDDDVSVVNWDWGKDGGVEGDDNTSVGSSNVSSSQSSSTKKSGGSNFDDDSDGDDATVAMDKEEEDDKDGGDLDFDSPTKKSTPAATAKEDSEADRVMKAAALKATQTATGTDDSTMSPGLRSPSPAPTKNKKTRTYGKSDMSSSPAAPQSSSKYLSPFKKKGNDANPDEQQQEQPEKEKLIVSTDRLFSNLGDDYDNVSVIDIIRRLEPEYGVAFSKETVKIVKQRIKSLLLERLAQEGSEEEELGEDEGDVDVDEDTDKRNKDKSRSKTARSSSNNLDSAFSETVADGNEDQEEDEVNDNKVGSGSIQDAKKKASSDLDGDDSDSDDDEFPSSDDWETQPPDTSKILTSKRNKKN